MHVSYHFKGERFLATVHLSWSSEKILGVESLSLLLLVDFYFMVHNLLITTVAG